jgi:hypothetical protein
MTLETTPRTPFQRATTAGYHRKSSLAEEAIPAEPKVYVAFAYDDHAYTATVRTVGQLKDYLNRENRQFVANIIPVDRNHATYRLMYSCRQALYEHECYHRQHHPSNDELLPSSILPLIDGLDKPHHEVEIVHQCVSRGKGGLRVEMALKLTLFNPATMTSPRHQLIHARWTACYDWSIVPSNSAGDPLRWGRQWNIGWNSPEQAARCLARATSKYFKSTSK